MLILEVPLTPEALKERLLDWASKSPRYPFFNGTSQDLDSWFSTLEHACEENEILAEQYVDAAIIFIQGELAHVMDERRIRYLENSGDSYWEWCEFKPDMRRVMLEAEKIMAEQPQATPLDQAKEGVSGLREKHPYVFASAGSALMIGGSFVVVPALGVLALGALGLSTAAAAGGTFSAIVQAIVWNGATTGLFSLFKSTVMRPAAGADSGATPAKGAGKSPVIEGAKPPAQSGESLPDAPPPSSDGVSTPTYRVYQSKRNRQMTRLS